MWLCRPVRRPEPFTALRPLVAFLALTVALIAPLAPARALPTSEYCADAEEQTVLTLINDYRQQNGLQPLVLSQSLGATADHHSGDMGTNNYFSHTRLDGGGVGDSLREHGYTDGTYGENIAAGVETAADAFAMWQGSASHNANMLQSNFGAIGIGRAYQAGSGYGWYWTTVFGGTPDAEGAVCGGRASQALQDETVNADANASAADLLNLRAGAGPDNAILAIIPNNARLQVIGVEQDGYLPVTYDGQTGWVLAEAVLLDGTAPLADDTTTTVTTPDSTTITTPPTTTTSTTSGTVSVPQTAPGAAFRATDDLNLRAGPSYDDAVLAVIPAGSTLSPTGTSDGGFLGVTFAGTPGWVDAAYVASDPAPATDAVPSGETVETAQTAPATDPAASAPVTVTVATALDTLNLRATPSADGAIVSVVPAGATLSLTGENDSGYLGVSYEGVLGWADAAYIA